jgi:site-specific DNA-methyltransferase (adenine-specific)
MMAVVHHGECLEVMRTIPDGIVDAIITDPPYLRVGAASASAVSRAPDATTPQERQFFDFWMREMWREWARVLNPKGAAFLTIDWRGALSCEMAAIGSPLRFGGVGVWDKETLGLGFMMRHVYECFVVARMPEWQRTIRNEPDLWRLKWSTRMAETDNDAEKPPELFARALRLINPPAGGVVLDPFAGSGSCGVAAVAAGYSYIAIEREAHHVDTINKRLRVADDVGRMVANG